MRDKRIAALLMMWDGQFVGLITEHDIVEAMSIRGPSACSIRLNDIQRNPVASVSKDDTIRHAISVMAEENCTHLVVADGAHFIGLISSVDIIDFCLRAENRDRALIGAQDSGARA